LSPAAEFGTIVPGNRADLILVESNPLQDVANAQRRVGVMARGRWMPAATLQKMLDDIPQACLREKQFLKRRVECHSEVSRYLRENDPFDNLALSVTVEIVREKGFVSFKQICIRLRKREPDAVILTKGFTDALGVRLRQLGRKDEALEVFSMNTEAYPKSEKAQRRLTEDKLQNAPK
jgi:hypothetical protein